MQLSIKIQCQVNYFLVFLSLSHNSGQKKPPRAGGETRAAINAPAKTRQTMHPPRDARHPTAAKRKNRKGTPPSPSQGQPRKRRTPTTQNPARKNRNRSAGKGTNRADKARRETPPDRNRDRQRQRRGQRQPNGRRKQSDQSQTKRRETQRRRERRRWPQWTLCSQPHTAPRLAIAAFFRPLHPSPTRTAIAPTSRHSGPIHPQPATVQRWPYSGEFHGIKKARYLGGK